MRTSNKILLGIFVVPLLMITALHITLFAKYKSGNYVAMKTVEEDRFIRPALKNIDSIAVFGLDNFSIVASDSLLVEIEKSKYGYLHYAIEGNILVIHGDSVIQHPDGSKDIQRSYQLVKLHLPSSIKIMADNSNLSLEGSTDSTKAGSYYFNLQHTSSFKTEENHWEDSTYHYFKGITIKADRVANIELAAYGRIQQLNLTMLESQFIDNDAHIGEFNLNVDNNSAVTLKGGNLKKINAIKKP